MLLRCCKASFIISLIFFGSLFGDNSKDSSFKNGKKTVTITPNLKPTKEFMESITPQNLKGKKFDGEKAKTDLLNTKFYELSESQSKEIDPSVEALIENVNKVMDNSDLITTETVVEKETIEKCLFETLFIPITLTHTLKVEIQNSPQVRKKIKLCKGHHSESKSNEPSHDKHMLERKLRSDPEIKNFFVFIKEKNFLHRDMVVADWKHVDNSGSCDAFDLHDEIVSVDGIHEKEIWECDQPELLDRLDCKLISIEKGSPETRIVDGHQVTRESWFKKQHLQCRKNHQRNCDFLKERNCYLIEENCLKKEGNECVLWEKKFKCLSRIFQKSTQAPNQFEINPSALDIPSYQPNQNLPDITTKLVIFDEMKKELENSQTSDASKVLIFSGNYQQCSKNVKDDLFYDCCDDMDGFTNKLKLSKCSSEEIALAEARRKGLCHYVGKKKEQFLGLWTSRKEHIFCVFSSKLSRVFQEKARDQLGLDWGTPENPDCRGLRQEEIKRLDFSKLDLIEAFELPNFKDNTDKILQIEERLKNRLKEA